MIRILGLCLAVMGFSCVHAVSCDQLEGIQRLACEKSVQKRGLKRVSNETPSIDTAANIMQTIAHQKNQAGIKQKTKVRLPHNRRMGPQRAGVAVTKRDITKKNQSQSKHAATVSDKNKTAPTSGVSSKSAVIADASKALVHKPMLQSDADVGPDFVMPSRMDMLVSDADTMYPDGIGDAELYRVY